jgi:pectin methylesterase-like acyl-CoA thioesterase
VIHVPTDASTIQRAVDQAKPGTLVLVAAGVYHEAVSVTHSNIVIRGESRTGTIVDCAFSTDGTKANAFEVTANGVAIENLTARNTVDVARVGVPPGPPAGWRARQASGEDRGRASARAR